MYPQKNVSIIHSRDRLLNSFGPGLHEYAMKKLKELGVTVYLGERAPVGADSETPSVISLKSGKLVPCDLLVCRSYPQNIIILTGNSDQMHWSETRLQHSLDTLPIFDLELCNNSGEEIATDN